MKYYFARIISTFISLFIGLKITWKHFLDARTSRKPIGVKDKGYFEHKDGIFTLQYPKEEFPVPTNGRYKLHNEVDDCIVCDKCAKVCPVNCIDIEPIRSVEEIGKTSDGTSKKIYPAKFDIDMSKCCFCGLCTVVCPTECLTMTKEHDFSVFDLKEHNVEFSVMSEELIAQKKKEIDEFNAAKEKAKTAAAAKKVATGVAKPKLGSTTDIGGGDEKKSVKPAFRPKLKSSRERVESEDKSEIKKPKVSVKPKVKGNLDDEDSNKPKAAKPAFKPKVKLKPKTEGNLSSNEEDRPKKPVFRPKIKPKTETTNEEDSSSKPSKPVVKPKVKSISKTDSTETTEDIKPVKPVFKPKIKLKKDQKDEDERGGQSESNEGKSKKPVIKPKIKKNNKE